MCTCPVTACAGGTNAVGDAFRHIRDGYAEVMLCGGAEAAITPLAIGGFTTMQRPDHASDDPSRASIPFDAERSGFVMGEGAAVLMLEELRSTPRPAGAQDLGRGDGLRRHLRRLPHHRPRPGRAPGAPARMEHGPGRRRRWPRRQVDYINAHGTSTPLNDRGRDRRHQDACSAPTPDRLIISSTKSMTGHMLGASRRGGGCTCRCAWP